MVIAFDDRQTISPGLVRNILEKDVRLTRQQAADIL